MISHAALATTLVIFARVVQAQGGWTASGNTTSTTYSVGIGTDNPAYPLDVNGNVHASGAFYFNNDAYAFRNSLGAPILATRCGGNTVMYSGSTSWFVRNSSDSATPMYIQNSGAVGIATTDPCNNANSASVPNCKLPVNGGIQAQAVVVNSNWSDYVFAPDYRLAPLSEVADYIKDNHHLPGIPSEAEVQQSGVSLGDMQSKLLAKIEELTLHMIQTDQRNSRLEQQNQDLLEQNQAIRKEIETLKAGMSK